jgi:DNA-directed RNA polymerase subunit RPC12/RpoP
MFKTAKRIVIFALALCMLFSVTPAQAAGGTISLHVSGNDDYSEAYAVLEIVNRVRAENGRSPLSMDKGLLDTAMQRAAEISVYYSHTRPDGSTCFTIFPYSIGYFGENIAAGQRNADAVMNSWVNSQMHFENIISPNFRSIGIGCFYQNGTRYWVQCFSSVTATVPQPRSDVRNVTASFTASPDNLELQLSVKDNGDGTYQPRISNLNITFPYDFENHIVAVDNTTYRSDNGNITVGDDGLLHRHSCGSSVITCSIGGSKTLTYTVPATGHSYISSVTPPTCTEAGYTTYTCSVCGDTYTAPGAPATGHSFGSWTDNGNNHIRRCKNCDATETASHTYRVTQNPPICTSPGSTVSVCTDCGKTVTETVPATGHSYISSVTPPTCTEAGYTTYTCSVCGDTYTAPGAPALGHSYRTTVIPPTTEAGGYTLYECIRGDHSYKADYTDPITPGIQYTPGDVNGDGSVGNSDLILVARHVVNLVTLSGNQFMAGDMDASGTISNTDVILLARLIVGLI